MVKKKIDPYSVWDQLKGKKNVHSFSGTVKNKISDGKKKRKKALIVYVTQKEPITILKVKDQIPRMLDGIITDVQILPPMRALPVVTDRFRPIQAGISAMLYTKEPSACTFGWFGIDRTDGKIVYICNNHCGSDENKAAIGSPYLQPSTSDGGVLPWDTIGGLKRFVPIEFTTFNCAFRSMFGLRNKLRFRRQAVYNQVDLAVIEPTLSDANILKEVFNIGKILGKRRGTIGELAEKTGRTTGHTVNGALRDNDWYGQVGYGRGNAMYGPCGLIEGLGWSTGGDSSSLIVWMKDRYTPGILFAGGGGYTLFNHYEFIEELGNLDLWTG